MPKPRWTTPAQRAWLEERIPAFNEAQEKGITTKMFYPQLYTAWDRAFNPQPPSAAEIKDAGGNLERAKAKKRKFMEIRLSQWFHNTARPTASCGKRDVIKLQKNSKLLPAWQAYQSLYYEQKLKPLVDEAYKKHTDNLPEGMKPKPRVAIIGEIAREQLRHETPEVLAEVEDYRVKVKDEPEEPSLKHQIAAYQSNINKIPATLAAMFKTLEKETGWSFTIIAGGPSPAHDGKIGTLIMHSGQIPETEVEFDEYMGDEWNENVLVHWDKFLHEVYPPDVRKFFSLASTESSPGPEEIESDSDNNKEIDTSPSYLKKQKEEMLREFKGKGLVEEKDEQEKNKNKRKRRKNTAEGGPPKRANRNSQKGLEGNASTSAQAVATLVDSEIAQTPATASPASQIIDVDIEGNDQEITVVVNDNHQDDKSPLCSTTSTVSPNSTSAGITAGEDHGETNTEAPNTEKNPIITNATGNGEDHSETDSDPPNVEKTAIITHTTVTNISAISPEDDTANTGTNEIKKIDLNGDKPIDTVTKRPSPRLVQAYLQESNSYLSEVSNLKIWEDLVDTWLSFETGCPQRGSILTKNRPDQVAWWLKRGRKSNIVPTIEKPSEFATAWQEWWKAMQPDWRRNDSDDKDLSRRVPTDNAWSNSKLLRSGPVGFRLIIMALGWWGQVVNLEDQDEGETQKVLEAVEDVQWVLNQALNSFASESMTKKRSLDNGEPSGTNKKSRLSL